VLYWRLDAGRCVSKVVSQKPTAATKTQEGERMNVAGL